MSEEKIKALKGDDAILMLDEERGLVVFDEEKVKDWLNKFS